MTSLLFSFLVKGAVITTMAVILMVVLCRLSAAQRRAIWSGVFVALACLPLAILFPLPVTSPFASHLLSILPQESFATYSEAATPPTGQVALVSIWERTAEAFALTWLAVFLALLIRRAKGAWRLRQLHRGCRAVTNVSLLRFASEEARELGLKWKIRLLESEKIAVPMVTGALFPKVILPTSCRGWSEAGIRAALRHEFGHVSSRDTLVRSLAGFVCAFHWPNPLVWAAGRSLCLAQEQACDDLVLKGGAEVQEYAAQLLSLSRSAHGHPFALAMAQPSQLEQRLCSLVEPRRNRASVGIVMQGAALFIGAFLFATAAEPVLQDDVNIGLTSGWIYTNGPEYPPGAVGNYGVDPSSKTLTLSCDFKKGGQYVAVYHELAPVNAVSGVKINVSGPGGGLTVALSDATGQTLLYRLGAVDASTHTLEVKLAHPSDSYGGANDRTLHLPVKAIRLAMEKNPGSLSGTLNFTGVTLETAR